MSTGPAGALPSRTPGEGHKRGCSSHRTRSPPRGSSTCHARRWQQQGRRADARDLLVPIDGGVPRAGTPSTSRRLRCCGRRVGKSTHTHHAPLIHSAQCDPLVERGRCPRGNRKADGFVTQVVMRGRIPPCRCSRDSSSPRAATGPQRSGAGRHGGAWQPATGSPVSQASLGSVSQGGTRHRSGSPAPKADTRAPQGTGEGAGTLGECPAGTATKPRGRAPPSGGAAGARGTASPRGALGEAGPLTEQGPTACPWGGGGPQQPRPEGRRGLG